MKMINTYQEKTANGGSYIDGVPILKWGEWKDCTYEGTLALIFDVIVNLADSIRNYRRHSLPNLHSDDGKTVMIPRDWEVQVPCAYALNAIE